MGVSVVRRCVAALALIAALPGVGAAHDPPKTRVRELVRAQGHRDRSPAGLQVARHFVIAAGGNDYEFFATDWQSFEFQEAPPGGRPEHERVVLQGRPELLARFTAARADQLVTIFAERRPGGSDWFVISIDVCPP